MGCPEEAAFLDLLRTCDLLSRGPAQMLKAEDLSAAIIRTRVAQRWSEMIE